MLFALLGLLPLLALAQAELPEVQAPAAFSAPPNGRQLCDEHVLANVGEVHWQLYAYSASPETTVREYLARLHLPAPRGDGRHLRIRGPNNLIHDVYPASELATGGPHCAEGVRQGEQTLVRVSVFHEFTRPSPTPPPR